MDDPALTMFVLLTLLAAPSAESVTDRLAVPPVLASHTRLPMLNGQQLGWTAKGLTLRDGMVVNDRPSPVSGALIATLRRDDGRVVVKRFAVTVLGRDATSLRTYARVPTSAREANQPVVARSVHFALRTGNGPAVPLNDNYGVLFARGEAIGVDRVALHGIADPAPFHFSDGSIGIIATRVDMAGMPQPSGPILFRADPRHPADFVDLGPLPLPAPDGVVAPHAVWDSAARRYLVGWTDRRGRSQWTTVRDLTRSGTPGNIGERRHGTLATTGGDLPIPATTATTLTNRFGRIVNTRVTVPAPRIAAGNVAALDGVRARLDYSDGSNASRPIDWNRDDLRRIAAARSGTYRLRGTVRQRAYPQIFAYNRADPVIYRYAREGRVRYLFVATDDTDNDNVASYHLPIRVAGSIAALADDHGGRAREVDLLNRRTRRDRTAEGRTIAGCYWAPELHEIGGRLSILFAPCFNRQDDRSADKGAWDTVQAHIMQLRPGGDPADPDAWSRPAAVRKADGSPLGRADFPANISLDMSYFTVAGQSYYIWSQRYLLPDGGTPGDPLTWIAPVDPRDPTRLASPPRPIVVPQLSFEENLAEGGFVQVHDGRVHLTYSGSGVSPTYVVGGVWAPVGADLTDIASWHKWQAPLQKSQPMPPGPVDYRNVEQGPGHGAFTTDEDGTPLYVYHSWGDGVGGNGRDTRVRRLHWAADSRPVLDMTPDEEVAPANRDITTTVRVGG